MLPVNNSGPAPRQAIELSVSRDPGRDERVAAPDAAQAGEVIFERRYPAPVECLVSCVSRVNSRVAAHIAIASVCTLLGSTFGNATTNDLDGTLRGAGFGAAAGIVVAPCLYHIWERYCR